jgi:hypothetical protein
MSDEASQKAREQLLAAIALIEQLPDAALPRVLNDSTLGRLFESMAARSDAEKGTAYEYLMAHKEGLRLLAATHQGLSTSLPVKIGAEGKTLFLTPDANQWFDDGVMFLQGAKPWEGLLGLFRNGEVRYGI